MQCLYNIDVSPCYCFLLAVNTNLIFILLHNLPTSQLAPAKCQSPETLRAGAVLFWLRPCSSLRLSESSTRRSLCPLSTSRMTSRRPKRAPNEPATKGPQLSLISVVGAGAGGAMCQVKAPVGCLWSPHLITQPLLPPCYLLLI